jgi:GNAT superfamily N-acetyltransferase
VSQKPADTSKRRWKVRPANLDDASSIVTLLNIVYGDWGNIETWLWKYKRNPTSKHLISAVAESEGRIVGHYGIVPLRIVHQGKVFQGAQAVDAAVLPEFRRQGMFLSLGNFVLNDAAGKGAYFTYAFAGLYSLNVNHELGFHPIMYKPEMVRILSPKEFIIENLNSLPVAVREYWRWRYQKDWSPKVIKHLAQYRLSFLWTISWLSAPVWRRTISVDGIDVESVEGFDSSFDRFFQVCQSNITFGLVKDSRYLTWRYLEHPDRDYHILVALEKGDMVGYMILFSAQDKSSICECEILSGKEQAVYALLEYAAIVARQAGSRVIDIWVADQNPMCNTLKKAGFISQHRLRQWATKWKSLSLMLYRIIIYTKHLPVQTQKQIDEDSDYWSLSMGDSDLV